MPISVDAAVTSALASEHFDYALCVQIPGPYNVTNNPDAITVGGVTFSPDQILMEANDTQRQLEIKAADLEIVLGNADQTIYQDYIQNDYTGQSMSVWFAFVNDKHQRLNANSYMPLYRGLLDSWSVSESGTRTQIVLRGSSHWTAFSKVTGRRTNSGSQQQYFPNDTVFEYSHQEELPYKWGL